jgi:MYXO-CTERM domain-containing protein
MVVDGELPGQPFFYTYHPEMNCDPGDSCANYADPQAICDGCAAKGLPCENGLECCWGENLDIDDTSVSLVADTWYAVETMVRANTPGQADGEMSLWIDGQLVGQHGGIGWRDDPVLQLNHFIVWNYYPETEIAHSIWFDDLVISTAPIGLFGGMGGDSTGGGGSDGADDGVDEGASEGASVSASATADDDGASASASATADDGGGDTSATSGADQDDDAAGCGCTAPSRSPRAALLVLVAAAARRRRQPSGTG